MVLESTQFKVKLELLSKIKINLFFHSVLARLYCPPNAFIKKVLKNVSLLLLDNYSLTSKFSFWPILGAENCKKLQDFEIFHAFLSPFFAGRKAGEISKPCKNRDLKS